MPSDIEWKFPELRNDDEETLKIFLWEYARECQPLIDLVEEVRDLVTAEYQIYDEKEIAQIAYGCFRTKGKLLKPRRLEVQTQEAYDHFCDDLEKLRDKLDALLGNFNLGLFFAPEFPQVPWFQPKGSSRIRKEYEPWTTSLILPPLVSSFEGDLSAYFATGDRTVLNELEDRLGELMENYRADGRRTGFHCFIVPDAYFDSFDKYDLLQRFKKHLDAKDRQKVRQADLNTFKPTRDNLKAYLRNLSVARVIHQFAKREGDKKFDVLGLKDLSKISDFRRDFHETFRQVFKVPIDEFPLCWEVHPTRAEDYRF